MSRSFFKVAKEFDAVCDQMVLLQELIKQLRRRVDALERRDAQPSKLASEEVNH